MNNLKIFRSDEFGEVRVLEKDGQPWFVAKDICLCLELSNASMAIGRLDADEKGISLIDTLGGEQELLTVNEYGLYNLIMASRKPEAKKFKRWVTHEVLPSIRQNGSYGLQSIPTDLQVLQGMLNKLIQQETEIKTISEQTQAIRDTIVAEYDNWREEIKRQINAIQKKSSMTYQNTYNTLYDNLEKRARCDLSARVRNGRDRLTDSGATKTKIEAFGRMDVIEADARLREIFTSIVKEFSIKYVA